MSEPAFYQTLTPYTLGTRVIDSNGAFQQVTIAGTSGVVAPVWNTTFGGTTDDASPLIWTLVGYWTSKFVRPNSPGPYDESLVDAISISTGPADAGKVVLANASGKVDSSFATGAGSTDFADLTTGTNTSAAMVVGSGASIIAIGAGVLEATELQTPSTPVNISGNAPLHAGQLLISQPGNTTAVWADPLVQGLFAPGINVATGNSGGPINPVLIGAQGPSDLLTNIKVDSSGNLFVTFSGTIETTDAANATTGSPAGTVVELAGAKDTVGNAQPIKSTTTGTLIMVDANQAEAALLSYYSYDSGAAYKTISSGTIPLWSVRANSSSITFLLRDLEWFTDGSVVQFQLIKNPATLTGNLFVTGPGNMQVDTSATVVSGGTVVMSGYVGFIPLKHESLLQAVASGVPGDVFTMAATTLSGNPARVAAQLRWSEQSVAL